MIQLLKSAALCKFLFAAVVSSASAPLYLLLNRTEYSRLPVDVRQVATTVRLAPLEKDLVTGSAETGLVRWMERLHPDARFTCRDSVCDSDTIIEILDGHRLNSQEPCRFAITSNFSGESKRTLYLDLFFFRKNEKDKPAEHLAASIMLTKNPLSRLSFLPYEMKEWSSYWEKLDASVEISPSRLILRSYPIIMKENSEPDVGGQKRQIHIKFSTVGTVLEVSGEPGSQATVCEFTQQS